MSSLYATGIPRFYDIGGFLAEPAVFQRIVDIFVARYAKIGIDSVAGLDARGFSECPRLCVSLLHTVCSNSSSALARIIETIQYSVRP